MKPTFFATPSQFRKWLEEHHDKAPELWVGYYKKISGKPSITWPESVDAALCFGWIDSIRKSLDTESYVNRFTPRGPRSIWSAVNIKRFKELGRRGLVHPAGRKAFEQRAPDRSGLYSYEQRHTAALDASSLRQFRANRKAWDYFEAQAPWYRKTAIWWMVSAKKEETRQRRLATLMRDSARGRRVPPLTSPQSRAEAPSARRRGQS